jgi:hypothetical protein
VVHSDICLRFGRRRFLKGREEFRECHNIKARNIGGLKVCHRKRFLKFIYGSFYTVKYTWDRCLKIREQFA